METIYYQMSSEGEKMGLRSWLEDESITKCVDEHFEVVDFEWPEPNAETLGLMWALIIVMNITISLNIPKG